jgi:hypothetical protein
VNTWFRIGVVAVLLAVAYGGLPHWPNQPAAEVVVETPSANMQTLVTPVGRALQNATPFDRAQWAAIWTKAAKTVAGDATDMEVVFTDTRALRAFNVIALRLAWRRMGGVPQQKYPGLAEAVEAAFKDVLGMDVKPVTPEVRQAFVDLCNALAWAGMNRG